MGSGNDVVHVHVGCELPEGIRSPDVYFTPGYGHAASVAAGGDWILLEAFDGAWQMPLILRSMADGSKDAISPYGYSGVFADPSLSSVQVHDAWSATITCLRELGVISVLLRHSPLVSQAPDLPGMLSIVGQHPTVVLESEDEYSAWRGMAGTCRTKIRKALENGFTGAVKEATDQDVMKDSCFRHLYEQTMQRLDAAPRYFFSDEYYKRLSDGLGSNLLISEVVDQMGVVVSSGLLMRHGPRLHAHLVGSSADNPRMGANNLLTWTEMQYSIEHDVRQYHLGGGRSARDGLFQFKRSFGGHDLDYNASGQIINADVYWAKVHSRAIACDISAATLLAPNYFPAYRAGTVYA